MPNLSEEISPLKKHLYPLCLLIISIAALYYNSLSGEFIFDDDQIEVRTNLHLSRLDVESIKGTFFWSPNHNRIYRPIACLTLGLNYYFGGENPFGYHVVNIAIHILCSFAVYLFFYTLLSIPEIQPSLAAKYRYEISVIATFLFALHPLQANVAAYIIQRMASLAALFYVISITGYIQFRMGTLPGTKQSAAKTCFGFCIFLLCGLFALLSKENAAFLPVIILFTDCLFFYPFSNRSDQKKIRIVYTIVIFILLFVLVYVGPKYYFQFLQTYETRNFTPIERLLTETRIIFFYLFLIFLPNQSLLNLNHDFSLSTSLISPPQTLISIVGIIILLFLLIRLKKRYSLFSYIIFWYLGNLLIESTLVPLELIFEHRTYLPGIMIFFLMAYTIIYISNRLSKKYIMILFTSLILITYSHGTYLRNFVFNNERSLWLDILEKSPNYARAYSNLGKELWDDGYPLKAKVAYEKALELKPDMVEPLINLSVYYLTYHGDTSTALKLAKKALRTDRKNSWPPKVLADIYMIQKDYQMAEHFYTLSIKRLLFRSDARSSLGVAKIHLGKTGEAIKIFQDGIELDPSFEGFYLNLAKLYYRENRLPDAIQTLEKYPVNFDNSSSSLKIRDLLQKYKAEDSFHKATINAK